MSRILRIACVLPCFISISIAETVDLVRDGQIRFSPVLSDSPDPQIVDTVEDFNRMVRRWAGPKELEPSTSNPIPFFLGEAEDFLSLKEKTEDLAEEDFYLRVDPGAIHVIGGSPLGVQHGVYTLLRDLGFRFVLPGDLGICFPVGESLSLETGERIESPDFRMRMINCYGLVGSGEDYQLWLKRNRCYRPPLNDGHNLTRTLEREAAYEERPDLYALIQGERKKTQICTSNPEAVELVIRSVNKYLDKHPDLECYSLCPDDNWDFCECENCRALDTGHIDRGGLPSISDRYQVFLNQVLEGISKKHPDTLISTYSYNPNHTDPPQETPVHPNTAVFVTTNNFCSAHGSGNPHCPSRADFVSLLKEWRALTDHVYIYDYDPEPYCGGLPWPMRAAHSTAIPIYRELGVKGMALHGQNSWAVYFPAYYMAAQLLWDSSADPEEVYWDMLNRFFGEAAGPMREYYDSLESSFLTFEERAAWGMDDYPKYFSSDSVMKAKEALEKVNQIPVSDRIQDRISMVKHSFDLFDSYLQIRRMENPTYEEFQRESDRLQGAVDGLSGMDPNLLNADYAREKLGIALGERVARE
ncbi:MAG: DUF4838 domain-containing protein, partial [Candidatus Omnitrophica bacterium]|nr:DUF4838 domain-containing protein [Candidatus Omnitrophota bacterium]